MVALTKKQTATQPADINECALYTDAMQESTGYEHLNDCNDTGNAQRFLLQYGNPACRPARARLIALGICRLG